MEVSSVDVAEGSGTDVILIARDSRTDEKVAYSKQRLPNKILTVQSEDKLDPFISYKNKQGLQDGGAGAEGASAGLLGGGGTKDATFSSGRDRWFSTAMSRMMWLLGVIVVLLCAVRMGLCRTCSNSVGGMLGKLGLGGGGNRWLGGNGTGGRNVPLSRYSRSFELMSSDSMGAMPMNSDTPYTATNGNGHLVGVSSDSLYQPPTVGGTGTPTGGAAPVGYGKVLTGNLSGPE